MHTIKGHAVTFLSSGKIEVDGKIAALGVKMTNGGHYTYIREDGALSCWRDELASLAGQKLTGPRRPIGVYEAKLAADIVAAIFK